MKLPELIKRVRESYKGLLPWRKAHKAAFDKSLEEIDKRYSEKDEVYLINPEKLNEALRAIREDK